MRAASSPATSSVRTQTARSRTMVSLVPGAPAANRAQQRARHEEGRRRGVVVAERVQHPPQQPHGGLGRQPVRVRPARGHDRGAQRRFGRAAPLLQQRVRRGGGRGSGGTTRRARGPRPRRPSEARCGAGPRGVPDCARRCVRPRRPWRARRVPPAPRPRPRRARRAAGGSQSGRSRHTSSQTASPTAGHRKVRAPFPSPSSRTAHIAAMPAGRSGAADVGPATPPPRSPRAPGRASAGRLASPDRCGGSGGASGAWWARIRASSSAARPRTVFRPSPWWTQTENRWAGRAGGVVRRRDEPRGLRRGEPGRQPGGGRAAVRPGTGQRLGHPHRLAGRQPGREQRGERRLPHLPCAGGRAPGRPGTGSRSAARRPPADRAAGAAAPARPGAPRRPAPDPASRAARRPAGRRPSPAPPPGG